MSPFEELVIPFLKAHQICHLHPRGLVVFPLLLFAWHLRNPSLYSTEISLALADSSRAMGNTHLTVYYSECDVMDQEVSEGWRSVLCEQGTLAADGCGQVGTGSQLIMIILLLVVCLWKRYYYYLTSGIRKDMIAPEEDKVMVRISKLISNTLLTSPFLEPLMAALVEEKETDYYSSLMKSIGKAVHKWGRVPMWRAPSFLSLSVLLPVFSEKCQKHCVTFHSVAPPHCHHHSCPY